jgi:YD repeat-containing protein
MDAALVHIEHVPARETVRDARGKVVGTMERQRHTQKLIARNARGVLVGVFDERSRITRDAHGRVVGRANLLGALLWRVR